MRRAALLALLVVGCARPQIVTSADKAPPVDSVKVALERTYKIWADCPGEDHDSTGTGVDLGNGLVATAKHVVEPSDGCIFTAETPAGHKTAAWLLRKHATMDLALVVVAKSISATAFGQHALGLPVIAVGFPAGELGVTAGVIAGLERDIGGGRYVRFDAPIWYGNSGGGVWDREGRLVGLSVAALFGREGWGLLIPVKYVQDML